MTITGCIQREADYRRAQGAGAGGAVGTGVGVNNEFILADATMGAASTTAPSGVGTSGAAGAAGAASTPAGSASAAAAKMAFELTGAAEGQASQYVGRRVEVMGKLKAAETTAAGATGGPTAGAPPRGVDVASRDLQLREIEVTSVRAATGTCAAQ